LVRGHADTYQIIGLQHVESFLFRQSHVVPCRCNVILADVPPKL
jgi:hypothetical protein